MKILLVGTGYMAREYVKVLSALSVDVVVVGRSEAGCEEFKKVTNVHAIAGGLESYLSSAKPVDIPCRAINAASVEELAVTTFCLLEFGIKEILLEKPGAMYQDELERIKEIAQCNDAKVYIAYNRRFYASTLKAQQLIQEDGGVSSFTFDFTEWAHQIEGLSITQQVLDAWIIANSSHVIDMAFYLGGKPKKMACFSAGQLEWHTSGSKFYGAGLTEQGAPFGYQSDWSSAGRWAVTIMTSKRKLMLCPLEKLFVMEKGSVIISEADINDELDVAFKPGVFCQVSSFLCGENGRLATVDDQLAIFRLCSRITNQSSVYAAEASL